MKIIFVRHGEPDYVNDSLTEKGWREAHALAERLSKWRVTDFYCSPMGRAQATASCTLKKMNRTAVTLDWMREFSYRIQDPVTGREGVPWDFIPSYWTEDPLMLDIDRWVENEAMCKNADIAPQYKIVCESFDRLLASYGYIREKKYYRMPDKEKRYVSKTILTDIGGTPPSNENEPVIVIFCHLGVTCLVLSHLLNIPFPLLTHGFFLPTTSLTILGSEEHWSNEAYFRVQAMGDVSHLFAAGEPLSSAGSFTEAFQG